LKAKDIDIELTDQAKTLLASQGFDRRSDRASPHIQRLSRTALGEAPRKDFAPVRIIVDALEARSVRRRLDRPAEIPGLAVRRIVRPARCPGIPIA